VGILQENSRTGSAAMEIALLSDGPLSSFRRLWSGMGPAEAPRFGVPDNNPP